MTEFINDEKICLENDLSPRQKKDILNKLSFHSKRNLLILNIAKEASREKIKQNEDEFNTNLKNILKRNLLILNIAKEASREKIDQNEDEYNTNLKNILKKNLLILNITNQACRKKRNEDQYDTDLTNQSKIFLENDSSSEFIFQEELQNEIRNLLILAIANQSCKKKIKLNEDEYNTNLKNQSKIFYFIITFLFFIIVGLSIYSFIKR